MAFALAPTRLSGAGVVRSAPVSIAAGVALVIAHLVRMPVPGLATSSFPALLLALLAVALVGRFIERRIGHGATAAVILLATVGAYAGGAFAGWLFETAGLRTGWGHVTWDRVQGYIASNPADNHSAPRGGGHGPFGSAVLGPYPWIAALVLAATAFMSALWRRRLRVAVLAGCITMVLYFGHNANVGLLVGALIGLGLGVALHSARRSLVVDDAGPRVRTTAATFRERRNLIALLVVTVAVGPVLARLFPGADGILSPLAGLVDRSPFTSAQVEQMCADGQWTRTCLEATQRVRMSGVGPMLMALLPPALTLLFATGLRRGRRAGWIGTVLVITGWLAAAIAQLFGFGAHGTGTATRIVWTVAAMTPLIVCLIALARGRRLFGITVPRPAARRAALASAVIVTAGWIGYVLAGLATAGGFAARPGIVALVVDFPRRLVPPRFLGAFDIHAALAEGGSAVGSMPLPESTLATAVFEWTPILVWAALGVVFWFLLHTPLADPDDSPSAVTKKLIHTPGGANLSWMGLWPGNAHWVAKSGRAAVPYREIGGVFLTVGEPVGDPAARKEAVREFTDFVLASGGVPCFYSVGDEVRAACEAAGFRSVNVGEETVISLDGLEFRGKKFQDVRTAINRARKEEVTSLWTRWSECPLAIKEQIIEISESWVSDKGLPEMGFTLGGIDELDDPEVRLLLAIDARGHVHGVTSWMPVYSGGELVGLTLDFMRRRADGFRPAMEFLIASCALDSQEEGLEFVSLSAAPLASTATSAKEQTEAKTTASDAGPAENRQPSGALDALLERLSRALEPVYGFRSLLAFKAKFQPDYVPLYMCYEESASLGFIGSAIARAYVGDVSTVKSARLVAALGSALRGGHGDAKGSGAASESKRKAKRG